MRKTIKKLLTSRRTKISLIALSVFAIVMLLIALFPCFMLGMMMGGAIGMLVAWLMQSEASIWPGQE